MFPTGVMLTQPSSNRVELVQGGSFTIDCAVTVPGVPVVVDLPDSTTVSAPYTVMSAAAGQSGVYKCRATSPDIPNSVQTSFTVTVLVFQSEACS